MKIRKINENLKNEWKFEKQMKVWKKWKFGK